MTNTQNTHINSYLSFFIGEEQYAINVNKVQSILELTRIMKIPRSQPFIRGVINLRGMVLPIVDFKIKFGLEPTEFSSNTCILVLDMFLENKTVQIGALVDSVKEVIEIEEEQILPPPRLGHNFQSDFMEGMFRIDNGFIMLLDVDKVFSSSEVSYMNSEMFDEEVKPIDQH